MRTRTRVDFLGPWRQSLLHPRHDALWRTYVDQFKPYYRVLVDFVEDQQVHNDPMKARALVILLVPDESQAPIYWKRDDSSSLNCLQVGTAKLQGLSLELLRLAASIIVTHNPDLRERARHEEREAVRALRAYSGYIRQLLTLLPPEEVEGVFACYDLNDPIVFMNSDEASGYQPFEGLLLNRDVPEVWKARADEGMQQIILAELRGERQPRVEHEAALRCYIDATIGKAKVRPLPYSVSLLARQIAFILEHAMPESDLLGWYQTPTLLNLLAGEEYQALRGKLAQFRWEQLRLSGREFHSAEGLAEAEMLLAELKANLLAYGALDRQIEASRPGVERSAAHAAREKAERNAIMRQMRGE